MTDTKKTAITEAQTQTQIIAHLAETLSLTKQQIVNVFTETHMLIAQHMMPNGSGEFTVPYLGIKVLRHTKPASKQRNGVNPLTGKPLEIPAKPAHDVVKIKVLKALKDVIEK